MIWLAWRQHRAQLLVASVIVVALAIWLGLTGPHLVHVYDTVVATCRAHNDCGPVMANFEAQAHNRHVFDTLLLVVPALIGMFWGAPLVARELDGRTFRLAWTQSVTRDRWFAVKVAVVGVSGVVVTGLLTLMITWWSSPIDRLHNTPFNTFDRRDIVPLAYTVFAFSLGVAAGAITRRTLPAMATTLAGFIAARLVIGRFVRPHLLSSLTATLPFHGPMTGPPGVSGLVNSTTIINSVGQVIGTTGGIGPNGEINFQRSADGTVTFVGVGKCPNRFPTPPPAGPNGHIIAHTSTATSHAVQTCVSSFHLSQVVTYVPTSDYWPLQWMETGIYVALGAAFLGLAFWWVRRRVN